MEHGKTPLFDFRAQAEKPGAVEQVDRASPIPLYYQLYQVLLAKILRSEWQSGAAIPTEKELSEQYDLSRTTVRQALQQLVLDGYLLRRQGQGTFVTSPKVRHGPQRPFGLTGYLHAHGLRPGWRLLGMDRLQPPAEIAAALGIGEEEQVLQVRRLRLADDEPIGLHTVYIPFPLAEQVREEHLLQGETSLYYLQDSLGVAVSESHRLIEAIPASAGQAKLLNTVPNAPLLLIRRTAIGADGHPVEYLQAVYRGDRFEYYVHIEH